MRYYISQSINIKKSSDCPCDDCIAENFQLYIQDVIDITGTYDFTDCTKRFFNCVYKTFGKNTFFKVFNFFKKNDIYCLWCNDDMRSFWTEEKVKALLNILKGNKLEIE